MTRTRSERRQASHPGRLVRGARRTTLLIAVPVAGVLLGTTSALAYWGVTGTGSGTAAASTMAAPTVDAGTTSGTALYPGLTADGSTRGGDLSVSVTNPNPFDITVSLTQDGQPKECATPGISLVGTPLTVSVGAGKTVNKTFNKVVSMGANAGDDCQGKTLSIPVTTASQSN